MLDFVKIFARSTKHGFEIYPKFIIGKSNDLMIRGGDFYAIWNEEEKLWSTDEQDAIDIIDSELDKYYEDNKSKFDGTTHILHMWDSDTGMIDKWHKYCQKQCRDNFHMLDEKLIFSNTDIKKRDYASKKLEYPLEEGPYEAWDELISVLYSPAERKKIEWAIGSIISGDSKKIQKFLVFYGSAGTGKSTVLNVIQQLFEGYYSVFDAKALGSSSNSFALESFKTNPLVAIQHDGDLSHIEDNTRLNSLVSHELMTVNEKFRSAYSNRFKAFLFMGTNKPVKITDGRSGLLRRLIDVTPTGNKVDGRHYKALVKQINFELGAIAWHCLQVYEEEPDAFDDYIPTLMMGASNDFYNYVYECYDTFNSVEGVSLKQAWELYKKYCEDARVTYPMSQRIFKEELKNYFKLFEERGYVDGVRIRNYYSDFMTEKFEFSSEKKVEEIKNKSWIELETDIPSILDKECEDCPAQYASSQETPQKKWVNVKTALKDIDTKELHYVKVPTNHIVIDFDITGSDGKKSLEKNLEEARKWPPTYAEVSKGGQGLHLHYIYGDDVERLCRVYNENGDIEIKVFTGNSSLRRRLSKCNRLDIATINSGLPLRKEKRVAVDKNNIRDAKQLQDRIIKTMNREYDIPSTKSCIDFIDHLLKEAYEKEEFTYDLTKMRNAIYAFAASSTNQSDYCVKLVDKMHFKSKEIGEPITADDISIFFFDIEVYPNKLIIVLKPRGEGKLPIVLVNPTPVQLEEILKYNLIGFNNLRYDNTIIHSALMGCNNMQLYKISQKIVSGDRSAINYEAKNISYSDVYDFCSKKQGLKKWEIELGLFHIEMEIPWDQPLPDEMLEKVIEYCTNDVIATEAVFESRQEDWQARLALADVADMTPNDSTNSLTTRIIFGKNRYPQETFEYRNMGDEIECKNALDNDNYGRMKEFMKKYPHFGITFESFRKDGKPLYPGYKFDAGKSSYRDVEEVGEGGYVYSEPGMYGNVALLDIASMHPSSILAENLFGDYTDNFADIVNARIAIKHGEYDKAAKMFGGKLEPYLQDKAKAKDLAYALKIAINSVYGLTSATFPNPFKDERNKDNIVAKRGALFMINLRHAVQQMGFTVAHIKTDSIKIPDATPEIIEFVMEYGKLYGYNFEHEATYDRMCLVNDAVYIAKYKDADECKALYGYIPDDCSKHGGEWTATGTQFQVPYVFKSLFSKEPIEFSDLCETKNVKEGTLYLDINELLPDVTDLEKEWKNNESSYKKGLINDTMFEKLCDELRPQIASGHDYHFVGKVGQFCPVKEGTGGGVLYRMKDDKYYAAAGTKGYRWLESEMIKKLGKEADIDTSYYEELAQEAQTAISAYGDFAWFVSNDPYAGVPYTELTDEVDMVRPVYLDMVPFN